MANIVSTYGTTEGFVTSALMGLGATQEDPNGRFYLDGNMVNVELSQVIAEAIYIEEIIRDGQSVTGKYTTDVKAGAIRVMLDTALPSTSRTLSYGGRSGTPGNAGVIDTNPPMLPTNDEFMIYMNQVNTQMLVFPDISREYMPLDIVARKIAGYARSVAQDRSASTIAEIIAYNVWRELNGGNNLYNVDDLKAANAYAYMINDLNAKLDNGDIPQGAYTYSTQGRTILGRSSFVNGVFNRNSGVILQGGDLAQSMLREYDLDTRVSERNYVGTNYKGYSMQFHWQSVPDYIWFLAEKYLGLATGSLNNLYGLAVSFEATAMGRVVDLGMKLVDAPMTRGLLGQPANIWGHEAFRKSYLIGDATLTDDYLTSTLGFAADKRVEPVHPGNLNMNQDKITVPVIGTDGAIIGFQEIASAPRPNGGNFQSGLKTVSAPKATPPGESFTGTLSVTLASDTPKAQIHYTLDGTTPTSQSAKYTAAISLTATTTVKAIAIKAGMVPSAVTTETYTLQASK